MFYSPLDNFMCVFLILGSPNLPLPSPQGTPSPPSHSPRNPMSFPNSSGHSAHFSPQCPSRVLMAHWAHSAPPAGMFADLCSSYSCSDFTGRWPKDSIPQAPPHSPALSSFHPLSDVSLGLSTYSHLLPALWVSALTAAHHKKGRLWPWLRTVPIRGQKHPEGSMTTCSLEYQQ